MKQQLTVRHASAELTSRLKALAEARGQSLNTTVLDILEQAVGVGERRARLEQYATWTEVDRREFETELAAQRVVDEALWR